MLCSAEYDTACTRTHMPGTGGGLRFMFGDSQSRAAAADVARPEASGERSITTTSPAIPVQRDGKPSDTNQGTSPSNDVPLSSLAWRLSEVDAIASYQNSTSVGN